MTSKISQLLLMLVAAVAVTLLYKLVIPSVNYTTVALTYLLIPLVAGTYGFLPGVLASVVCGFSFNFFFLPPVGTLTIHDPQNFVAFVVFLITALTANRLSSAARRRAEESERRREEVSKFYEVSRVIILTPDPETASSLLAQKVVEIFGMQACFISVATQAQAWNIMAKAVRNPIEPQLPVPKSLLQDVYQSGQIKQVKDNSGNVITCAPLRAGEKVTGTLICVSEKAEPATMEALAGLVALALERVRFLKELSKTEALKQSDELKSAILASVSHDLRTPLTSIQAAVENLLSTDVEWDDASKKEFHTIIKEEVDRLGRLVQNLLEMARIEAGECHPVKKWGAVSEMIADVIARCAESLPNHQVTVEIQEKLPLVLWDERLMSQVLACLLENAANYSPPGTEIVLQAELNEPTLWIHVKDQGPGVSPDEVPRIFQRFYRGRSASKHPAGTGMGLAIARGIMEAHGGKIHVEGSFGQGATFSLEIPVESKAS